MSANTSQITSFIVYSTINSVADSAALVFFRDNSPVAGEFLAQRASDPEEVPFWWRYHDVRCIAADISYFMYKPCTINSSML